MAGEENSFLAEVEALLNEQMESPHGTKALLEILSRYGGTTIYLPSLPSLFRARRDEEIRRRFNGHNYATLAEEYHVTESRIWQIVARAP